MRRPYPALAPAGIVFAALLLAAAPSLGGSQPTSYQGSRLIATKADGWCSEMRGNANALGLEGKKILLKTSANAKNNVFVFETDKDQEPLVMELEPSAGVRLLVTGGSGNGDRSALVELDPTKWKRGGSDKNPTWKYKDKLGTEGGVREATWKRGRFSVKARGENWQFAPDGEDQPVTVHLQLGTMWYCSTFPADAAARNDTSQFKAKNAAAPASCVDRMCGNGVQELGEACDDGNLVPADGCQNDCVAGECEGDTFGSTFEAIQSTIIDRYGCSSFLCHGQYDPVTGEPKPQTHESGLLLYGAEAADLPAGAPQGLAEVLRKNHESLLSLTPANNANFDHFVVAGDPKTSLMYQALFKRTHCGAGAANPPVECEELDDTIEGEGMPDAASGGVPLSAAEVEAVNLWVKSGAPLDGVVKDTPALLSACLPPATALKIDPPPHPGAGVGVQIRSTAWSLPQQSENEVCFPIYYDFTQTNLVPAEQQIDCPPEFGGPANHSGKCFRWHKQLLLQDPQSHHSIVHRYTGEAALDDAGWGPWTYKFDDLADPRNGQPCDPADIDPATGQNEGCSADPVRSAACLSYGPDDWNIGGFSANGGTAPQFSGSQETHYEQELADGVYSVLPMTGVVVFNSHAFNLTDTNTTMNQYLNLWLAAPEDQLYETKQIFEAGEIFWTELDLQNGIPTFPSVLPFKTREFCRSWTAPQNAKLFWLSSHTHRHGVRWRTYAPPNTPCASDDAACVAPPNDDRLIYYSTVYNDPVQLEIDPPLHMTDPDVADRTFLFCGLYDNGSTTSSPSVKRQSTSPEGPTVFGGFTVGGPCTNGQKQCLSPLESKRDLKCGNEPDPDRFCDSVLGANDGLCDACPLKGGFTTEDEMFILLGNYFVEE
jgi:cysteine-rich repeat protein